MTNILCADSELFASPRTQATGQPRGYALLSPMQDCEHVAASLTTLTVNKVRLSKRLFEYGTPIAYSARNVFDYLSVILGRPLVGSHESAPKYTPERDCSITSSISGEPSRRPTHRAHSSPRTTLAGFSFRFVSSTPFNSTRADTETRFGYNRRRWEEWRIERQTRRRIEL